jgi:hypothetical protein
VLQTLKDPGPEGVILSGGDGARERFKGARYGLWEGLREEGVPMEKALTLSIDTVEDGHFTRR